MESAPSQTSSDLCSFCGQQDNQAHQCRSEAFKLLNILAQDNQANPFSQVENLVFQGGGVKGIAYVGVLRKLFDEYKVHEQVKRVAGSSAGSIAALYICLGLSIETIEEYMNADMLEKLESEPQITVDGKSYAIRDVFDKVLDFSGNYTQDDLAKLLKDVITNLLKESLSWLQGILASKFASGTIANAIASFFAPSDTNKKTIRQRLNDLQDEIKKEEAKYNPEQAQQDQAKENVLKGIFFSVMDDKTAFHKALSQLLQQTFLAENPQFPDGWFPGDKVKEDLIKKPIEEGYKSKGLPVPDVDTLTFEDFANARVGDKPAFKKLYVTGFNTITQRTEVFSVDHTPNVLVVDAVRASMSIPAFFKSVPIREKNVHTTDSYPVRRMYISEDKWAVTRYMDGGILDNYPIWIFDDLQYCLGDNTAMAKTWKPKQKIGIRNPFTLGIKLIDCSQRQQFLNPYIDETRLRQRALELPNKVSVAGLLAVYFTASSEDNMHIQRGDTSRTIYVDNLGVTAISFKLSVPEKIDMQKAGELAVKQYVNYAKWGKLSEIGENYYPIQRPTTVAE